METVKRNPQEKRFEFEGCNVRYIAESMSSCQARSGAAGSVIAIVSYHNAKPHFNAVLFEDLASQC